MDKRLHRNADVQRSVQATLVWKAGSLYYIDYIRAPAALNLHDEALSVDGAPHVTASQLDRNDSLKYSGSLM